MKETEIFLVCARAANGTIGRDNTIPWHISADLRRFKMLTMGHPMIMGRQTFDSLPGLLPGRRHIVLTRNPAWSGTGAEQATSPERALELAGSGKVAVIGGAQIYALFAPIATRVELTEIHADIPGDTCLPPFGDDWSEDWREEHPASESAPAFAFVTLRRRHASNRAEHGSEGAPL